MDTIVYLLGVFMLYNAVDANGTSVCGAKYLPASDEYKFLESPGYPNYYPNNIECRWTILAAIAVRIEVLNSSVGFDDFCNRDNVTAYNGFDVDYPIQTWCGNQKPQFTSSGKYLTLRFQTDQSGVNTGFRLRYRNLLGTCGGQLTATTQSQSLYSPGHPNYYPNNLNCTWVIRAMSLTIKLEVVVSRLQGSYTCTDADYVKVYDDGTNQLLGTFCGSATPTYYSRTSSLRIIFVTNSNIQDTGFKMRYTTGRFTERCGSMSRRAYGYKQYLQSPGYPTTYSNLDCNWTISSEQLYSISLTVIDSDIESQPGCDGNRVSIYDGPTTGSPLLGKFCGNQRPTYVSSNNTITISIWTNGVVGRGFKLSYYRGHFSEAARCGTTALTAHMFNKYLTSPGYPHDYTNNLDCKWTIKASFNFKIKVTVLEADIEYGCHNDRVVFYDGNTTYAPTLGSVCSNELPIYSYVSSGNIMMVNFKTDGSNVRRGFRLSYKSGNYSQGRLYTLAVVSSDIDLPGCTAGTLWQIDLHDSQSCGSSSLLAIHYDKFLISPGHPNNYARNLVCNWTITTDLNANINVTVFYASFQQPTYCQHNALIIYDGSTTYEPLLAKFCGGQKRTFVSSSNAMLLIFKTDQKEQSGFKLSYKSIDYCGASSLTADLFEQSLTSPGFPSDYTDNADCTWSLTSDYADHVIYIEVEDIDIEYKYGCTSDYLQVFDDRYGYGQSLGKWCGTVIPDAKQSSGQYVFIKFHSDANFVASGFKLRYMSQAKSSQSSKYAVLNTSAIIGGLVVGCVLVVSVICFAAYRARKNSRLGQNRDGRGTARQTARRRVQFGDDREATNRGPATFAGPPSYDEVMANSQGHRGEAPPPYTAIDVVSETPGRNPTSVIAREENAGGTGRDGREETVEGEGGEREQTAGRERGERELNANEEDVAEPGVDAPDTQPILPREICSSEC